MPTASTDAAAAAVVSAPCPIDSLPGYLGRDHYSYSFALKQFRPLFDRWGAWSEVSRAESRADFALRRFRMQGLAPFHLAFAPLQAAYLTRKGANAAYVFWEFPDIPAGEIGNDPRHDWVRVAGCLDRILTASTFTRDAFRRAGVTTPVDVVPVPLPEDRFEVPDWQAGQRVRLDVPAYVFPQLLPAAAPPNPWEGAVTQAKVAPTLQTRLRAFWRSRVKSNVPGPLVRLVQGAVRAGLWLARQNNEAMSIPYDRGSSVELGGVVYLSVLNPFDPRKAWTDLLSAFLRALGDRADATLVLKLVLSPDFVPSALAGVVGYYHLLGIEHRCKLVLITDYLPDDRMAALTRAATYHVSASRAEGANLPLMDALAAGRPAIAPAHSSMRDYFSADLGWVIPSSGEPAPFPHDRTGRPGTTWQRLDWQALHDQFRDSYEVATRHHTRYRELSRSARARMHDHASLEAVWPRCSASLDALAGGGAR